MLALILGLLSCLKRFVSFGPALATNSLKPALQRNCAPPAVWCDDVGLVTNIAHANEVIR